MKLWSEKHLQFNFFNSEVLTVTHKRSPNPNYYKVDPRSLENQKEFGVGIFSDLKLNAQVAKAAVKGHRMIVLLCRLTNKKCNRQIRSDLLHTCQTAC